MDVAERKRLVDENLGLIGHVLKLKFPDRAGDDELFQEGFLALQNAAQGFDPDLGFKFSTYACKAIWRRMMRVVQMQYRDSTRARSLLQADDIDEPAVEMDPSADAVGRETSAENAIAYADILAKLDEREKAIMLAKFVDGLTLQKVGARFGICRERVRQIIEKAIERVNPDRPSQLSEKLKARKRGKYHKLRGRNPCKHCGRPAKAGHQCVACIKQQQRAKKRGRPRKDAPYEVAVSRRRAM